MRTTTKVRKPSGPRRSSLWWLVCWLWVCGCALDTADAPTCWGQSRTGNPGSINRVVDEAPAGPFESSIGRLEVTENTFQHLYAEPGSERFTCGVTTQGDNTCWGWVRFYGRV